MKATENVPSVPEFSFLGWLVLHERTDRYILMGSAIIVASVVLVTSAKISTRGVAEELPAVEAAGD